MVQQGMMLKRLNKLCQLLSLIKKATKRVCLNLRISRFLLIYVNTHHCPTKSSLAINTRVRNMGDALGITIVLCVYVGTSKNFSTATAVVAIILS